MEKTTDQQPSEKIVTTRHAHVCRVCGEKMAIGIEVYRNECYWRHMTCARTPEPAKPQAEASGKGGGRAAMDGRVYRSPRSNG